MLPGPGLGLGSNKPVLAASRSLGSLSRSFRGFFGGPNRELPLMFLVDLWLVLRAVAETRAYGSSISPV
jgi:hypothetical protein